MTEPLLVQTHGGVATLTLNRPELRNAFDDAQIERLTRALRSVDGDSAVRVVVVAGNGPAFCAGADLNWMKRMAGYGYEQNLADATALAEMLKTLDRMSKPTVARVHGPAFAGGTGLVAACDIALGTPEAKFCLSEAKLGLSPATISPYVIRAMGTRMARRYFLTADSFPELTPISCSITWEASFVTTIGSLPSLRLILKPFGCYLRNLPYS